jgi:hypothetical protein
MPIVEIGAPLWSTVDRQLSPTRVPALPLGPVRAPTRITTTGHHTHVPVDGDRETPGLSLLARGPASRSVRSS